MTKFRDREEYERWKAEKTTRGAAPPRTPAGRPDSVTLLGWGFSGLAVLMALGGISGLMKARLIEDALSGIVPRMTGDMPLVFKAMLAFFRHLGLFSLLEILVAAFMLAAGIQFLRLRAWARTSLEGISWLWLALVVCAGGLWLASWAGMSGGANAPFLFTATGAVIGFAVTGVAAAAPTVAIFFLRGKTVRAAVSRR
jgi:hypothetical protein